MDSMLMIILPLMGGYWRRKDGSNRADRWNIAKAYWRVLMSIVVIGFCYKTFGNWGLFTGVVTTISMLMGFETMTGGKGWTSFRMWYRYSTPAILATTPLIGSADTGSCIAYVLACGLAGLSYPIGAKWFSDFKYTEICEYICGAVVIGGLAYIG